MRRSRAALTLAAVSALSVSLLPGFASADPAPPQAAAIAFPAPGDSFAAPGSSITLRGVDSKQVTDLTVTGSTSGKHDGTRQPLGAAQGMTFDPAGDFRPGETVTVDVPGVSIAKASGSSYTFKVAVPGAPLDPNTLATAQTDSGTGAVTPQAKPAVASPTCTPTTHTYVSRPDLGAVPGACATGSAAGNTTDKVLTSSGAGATMFDSTGELVWFGKSSAPLADNFQRVNLNGQDLLAYFQGGESAVPGSGQGEYVLLDNHYNRVHTVTAGNGYKADIHELQLTPQGTALVGIYSPVIKDLSPFGGLPNSTVVDYVVQEVEIDTGKVLFEWHALDHISIGDSHFPQIPFAPYDYIHGNSIQQTADGNLLVSGRHTWATYKINRSTGDLMWTFGGRHSDFAPLTAGPGVAPAEAYPFCWQHDARQLPDGTYTVYDNGSAIFVPEQCGASRGLQMTLVPPTDTAKGTATITKVYRHTPDISSGFAGDMQTLSDGSRFLGFGSAPQAALYAPNGDSQLEVNLTAFSYRAFTTPWVGTPSEPPAAVVNQDRTAVYASWNGATEVSAWQVLAESGGGALQALGAPQPRTGFETTLTLNAPADAVVRVQALDAQGKVLGTSGKTVTGSTRLQGLNATAPIGPGTLDLSATTPNQDGSLGLTGAKLIIPPVNADFSLLFGLIPARETISLTPVDQTRGNGIPLTGTFSATGSTATFQANLHLDDFSVFGFSLQGLVGPTCATSTPVTVNLTSIGDPRAGAALTGTYTIPPFAGCGFADGAVSGSLSLPGNTIALTVS